MKNWRNYGILGALVLEIVIFSILSPHFLTAQNQWNVLEQNAAIAILAAGLTFVILTGGIDLCVGSLVALTGVVCADLLIKIGGASALSVLLACVAAIGLGLLAGLLNGLCITKMETPPFVATLAMLTIARGIALHYTQSRTISGLPESFGSLGTGFFPVLAMMLVFLAAWITLSRTPFGRNVYAVGSNPEAARLCGIRIDSVLLRVYAISGALAGISGVLVSARLNSGYPNAGALYELDAIAAVVVGGTSLKGGRGSVSWSLLGALVIGELNNGLSLLHVEYYSQKIVIGLVLILAAFLDRFRRK